MADERPDALDKAYFAGRHASEADAAAWKARFEADPQDMIARASWIGWRMNRDLHVFLNSPEFGAHMMWLVQNQPGSTLTSLLAPVGGGNRRGIKAVELTRAWTAALEQHSEDVRVLKNAASYFGLEDRDKAHELLLAIRARSKDDPGAEWALASHWLLRAKRFQSRFDAGPYEFEKEFDAAHGKRALEHAERAIELNGPDSFSEWYEVTRIEAAAAAGAWDRAAEVAGAALARITNGSSGRVTGNLAFHANRILGHVALRREDLAAARQHLLLSCSGGTSPQLSSFGPDWSLAREMLELGERAAVLEFLAKCRTIWSSHDDALDYWELQVQRGEQCSFSPMPKRILRTGGVQQRTSEPDDRDPATVAYVRGFDASDSEARHWEERVREHPDDLIARASFLGWCRKLGRKDGDLRVKIREHLEWLSKERPEHPFTPGTCSSFCQSWGPLRDPTLVESLTHIWREHLDHPDVRADVVGNAAQFFFFLDPDLSLELYARAEALDPSNPGWPASAAYAHMIRARKGRSIPPTSTSRLGDLYDPAICEVALEAAERAHALGTGLAYRDERLLTHMTVAAGARRWERATELAREALLYIPTASILGARKERCLHHAHLMLGHAALRRGDRDEARSHLKQAVACLCPSTPHFKLPNPSLALELLALGERQVMLEFLESMRAFSKDDQAQIDLWERAVRAGRTPDFGLSVIAS